MVCSWCSAQAEDVQRDRDCRGCAENKKCTYGALPLETTTSVHQFSSLKKIPIPYSLVEMLILMISTIPLDRFFLMLKLAELTFFQTKISRVHYGQSMVHATASGIHL